MKGKLVWSVFWALFGVFVIVVTVVIGPRIPVPLDTFTILLSVGVVFALLGVALLFLTVKTKVRGILKIFLLLTGASAIGLPVFILLHNVAYMLGMMWFGESAFGNGMSLSSSSWPSLSVR